MDTIKEFNLAINNLEHSSPIRCALTSKNIENLINNNYDNDYIRFTSEKSSKKLKNFLKKELGGDKYYIDIEWNYFKEIFEKGNYGENNIDKKISRKNLGNLKSLPDYKVILHALNSSKYDHQKAIEENNRIINWYWYVLGDIHSAKYLITFSSKFNKKDVNFSESDSHKAIYLFEILKIINVEKNEYEAQEIYKNDEKYWKNKAKISLGLKETF